MSSPNSPGPSRRDHSSEPRARRHSWRREELRTTFWLVPSLMVLGSALLFLLTYELDVLAFHAQMSYPWWVRTESADAGRSILIAIAAAVITVVGVVFSITILALTLASQQFGPRMMRNFVRDVGNQVTLGVFVATFVYSVLALGSITGGAHPFVPSLSITICEALLFVDVAVLIYFIHHIARSIQLPEVIAGIASDLLQAIDDEFPVVAADMAGPVTVDESIPPLLELLAAEGQVVPATASGYLQFVSYGQVVAIAESCDAVIRLAHRPGHFVVAGRPLGTVWPAAAASRVERSLARSHVTGPHRTLMQDPVFAIDQLVEIAIRALSAAVNDTFTALTCIDWVSAGLCRISGRVLSEGVYRDRAGTVRLIEFDPSYDRMVNRAFDKIRQSGSGNPAVVIRMLDRILNIVDYTVETDQRKVLRRQADMILRAAAVDVSEENDLEEVRARHRAVVALVELRDGSPHLGPRRDLGSGLATRGSGRVSAPPPRS